MKEIEGINIKFSDLLAILLTVLFVGLKLTHYIDWPWWLVFAPTWIPIALLAGCVIVLIIIYVLHKK